MADVSAEMVKQLRAQTGAGMMDCKSALAESKGSFDGAIEFLRKKGLKDVSKRSLKIAAEGVMGVYTHPGDQVVSIVELNCETDFVARTPDFMAAARDIAMHVAAMRPRYLTVEEVPAAEIEKEKEILLETLDEKQRAKAEMILPGKLEKFFEENVLLKQPFVKDDSGKKNVANMLEELSIKTGEKVQVRRFSRFEVGEGVERKSTDFAAEVAAMTAV